jgi:CRP-like cAMP-binding protein
MHGSGPSSDIGVLRRRGWLSQQPQGFADQLLGRGRIRPYAAKDLLHHEGDPPGGIYGLLSGGVGLTAVRPDGMPVLAHVFRAGDWMGHRPLLAGEARTQTLRTTEDSQVLVVPLAALKDLQASSAEAAICLGRLAEVASNTANQVVTELLLPRADQRVAAILLRTTGARHGDPADLADSFVMTQSDIGEMANASRNHVNRALQRFRAAGWVTVGYNRIGVRDARGLQAFIEQGAAGA